MTTLQRTFATLLLLAAASGAQAARTLPLESGTYIQGDKNLPCADAANAGTLYFDGKNLQGPHMETCKTAIRQVARDGRTFASQSTCSAEDKDGQVLKQTVQRTIRIGDRTHFQELMADGAPRAFHRCGAYPAS